MNAQTQSDDHLLFELVTPERIAHAAPVAMVEVPGEMGDFGVLPGHAPFFSMIRPGVVRVHEADGNDIRYFIPAGYAEVNPEGCTILAEHVRDLNAVDLATANKELEIARYDLSQADEADYPKQEKRVFLAEALVEALS